MSTITSFDLFAVDLPFRQPFKHAAAERASSDSVFIRAETDTGVVGWGECLPREYVSGETRDGVFTVLRDSILPALVGTQFLSLDDVTAFLVKCDGKAPPEWLSPDVPQTAAWSAVDLALLDVFSKSFGVPVRADSGQVAPPPHPSDLRYSTVISAESGWKYVVSLLKMRAYGFRYAKLKVGPSDAAEAVRLARRVLGPRVDLRVDANMGWDVAQALHFIAELSAYGVESFEQPVAAGDLDGLARLTAESGFEIMVDEGLTDNDSLRELVAHSAGTAVNVRISKCGGLIGAFERCRQAREAGLTVQIGCQVGESSLLSAAHVRLVSAVRSLYPGLEYLEGCFGKHLLREDPAEPTIRFGYGGRPPRTPTGPGLGVFLDEAVLDRWTTARARVR